MVKKLKQRAVIIYCTMVCGLLIYQPSFMFDIDGSLIQSGVGSGKTLFNFQATVIMAAMVSIGLSRMSFG